MSRTGNAVNGHQAQAAAPAISPLTPLRMLTRVSGDMSGLAQVELAQRGRGLLARVAPSAALEAQVIVCKLNESPEYSWHDAPQDHAQHKSGLPFLSTVQQEPKAIQALVDFVALETITR